MSEGTVRVLSLVEALANEPSATRATRATRSRRREGGRAKAKVKVRGMFIEPWLMVPGKPTVAEAIAKCESAGWLVMGRRSDGFSAAKPGVTVAGVRETPSELYDFLVLNDRLHSRRHHPRGPAPHGSEGVFLCEGCWNWRPESELIMVDVGASLASLFRHSICSACVNDGIIRRTIGAGYIASIPPEPH